MSGFNRGEELFGGISEDIPEEVAFRLDLNTHRNKNLNAHKNKRNGIPERC